MQTWTVASSASPAAAWTLLSQPAHWHDWAPHVGGAWGLGAPEVRAGARGAARLLGVVPVPARIVAVEPGRSWSWRVGAGLVLMDHRVEPVAGGGCEIAIDVSAPAPLERALGVAYGPVIRATLKRLAQRASDS